MFNARASHALLVKRPHPQKLNFREYKIHERGVKYEIHENIMPRKFGAIRYAVTRYDINGTWYSILEASKFSLS